MKLIETQRKSRVLNKAQFGCLKDAYTLNVTRGCEFLCVYCYARGYPEAPDAGEVFLYRNLPEKLAAELDNPRRRTEIDPYALENPGEFFAVTSEMLFELPRALQREVPEVYRLLATFYRQDPAGRLPG